MRCCVTFKEKVRIFEGCLLKYIPMEDVHLGLAWKPACPWGGAQTEHTWGRAPSCRSRGGTRGISGLLSAPLSCLTLSINKTGKNPRVRRYLKLALDKGLAPTYI